jgi:hypothetical protein
MILNFLNAQKPLSSSIFEPAWLAYFVLYFNKVNSLQKHSCLEVLNLVLQQAHRHLYVCAIQRNQTDFDFQTYTICVYTFSDSLSFESFVCSIQKGHDLKTPKPILTSIDQNALKTSR